MTSATSVGAPMGIYEYDRRARHHQLFAAASAWGAEPSAAQAAGTGPSAEPDDVKFVTITCRATDAAEAPVRDAPPGMPPPPSSDSFGHDDDDDRPNDKAVRRLAQNREAARKSRLRKKAYIQTLESSRMKLAQLEQELVAVRRRQGVFVGGSRGEPVINTAGMTPAALPNPGAAAFEAEYARWVEEQGRHAVELRAALQAPRDDAPEAEARLRALADAGLAHYDALFRARSAAAGRDAFLVLSGAWRSPAERFFLWIGGFRPSEVLQTLAPQLDPMSEEQAAAVRALRLTARQLEDALSQGLDKLQQTLAEALLMDDDVPDYDDDDVQMAGAVGKLGGLASFVDQADHLRQQTLRNMHRILAPRQAARGLLALADYCQRLRALSSLWAARPREPA